MDEAGGWSAGITKMKEGRTWHKAEHGVDLDTEAVVAVTLQGADQGDATTLDTTLNEGLIHITKMRARNPLRVSTRSRNRC